VPKIVQPHTGELGPHAYPAPYFREPGEGLGVSVPANDVWIAELVRQLRQHIARRRIKEDRFLPGLAVGQENQAALEIDFLPTQAKNFTAPAAGEPAVEA
jgi:hypothetical protein